MYPPAHRSSVCVTDCDRAMRTVSAPKLAGCRTTRRGEMTSRRGFTLVESIVACVIFCLCTLGVLNLLVRAYKMSALTRARDNARAVLATYSDQFQRLATTERIATHPDVFATRWLFYPDGKNGSGLAWGALSDSNVSTNPLPVRPDNLTVDLGTTSNPIPALVTRDMKYLEAVNGTTVTGADVKAAGYMLQGIFEIKYTWDNRLYTQTMSVVRAVP